jgi:Ni2+-binding GTPase involved in maturation of urease and hydrogenase
MRWNNIRLPIFDRLCPQGGISSGKTREDILSEVRKEAYAMRFLQGDKQTVDDDDRAEEDQSSNLATIG